jgi:putative MATE family efflux protein
MLWLALPVMAEESLTLLVGYTDWWLASHFLEGIEYKAAMGLMSYVLWLLPSLFAAIAIGATALIARSVGSGDPSTARRVSNQAFTIGVTLAVLVMVGTYFLADDFIRWMQLEQRAAELALRYILIIMPGIPFIMIEQVASASLRGAGDTVSGFIAKSIVNVVNMTLSPMLMLGLGPFPRLGWEGLAIGTICGHVIGGVLLCGLLLVGRSGLRLRLSQMKPDFPVIRRILRIGLPGGVDVLSVLGCHLIYVSIINGMGTFAAAAHGLGVQIEALAYLPATAFLVAATTMTGQFLGAKQPERAARSVHTTMIVATAFMTSVALVFYFGGEMLTTFFTGNANDPTGIITTQLLRIVAFSTPPLGILMVLTGALRGAGDTRMPLLITFVGLIGIRIPLACLFGWGAFSILGWTIEGFSWGLAGAWWAMLIDVVVRSLLISWRFLQGGWKKIVV